MDLTQKYCIACSGGEPQMSDYEIKKYLGYVTDWNLDYNPKKIVKDFGFENFKKAVDFVNKVASLAESEGHHPNIYLHSYKKVRIELWTHKIGGLHQNDFIMAAKIDKLSE